MNPLLAQYRYLPNPAPVMDVPFYVVIDIGPMEVPYLMSRYELAQRRLMADERYDIYHTPPATNEWHLVFKIYLHANIGINSLREEARAETISMIFSCLYPEPGDPLYIGFQPFLHPTFDRRTRHPFDPQCPVPRQRTPKELWRKKPKKENQQKVKKEDQEYVIINHEDARVGRRRA